MSHGKSMPLAEISEIAARVYVGLEKNCQRLVVAGSIRRQRARCSDIEIVLEPHFAGDLFGHRDPIIQPVHELLREAGVWLQGGPKAVRIGDVLGEKGVRLDVFIVHPPAQWGSIVAIRTGPSALGEYCVTKMRTRGFRHVGGHVETLGGAVCDTSHEDNFFKYAGVPVVAPDKRDHLARKVGAM